MRNRYARLMLCSTYRLRKNMIGGYGSSKTLEIILFEKNFEFIHVEIALDESLETDISSMQSILMRVKSDLYHVDKIIVEGEYYK